jgi:hypothetical protein
MFSNSLANLGLVMREQNKIQAAVHCFHEGLLVCLEIDYAHNYIEPLMVIVEIISDSHPETALPIITAINRWLVDNNFNKLIYEKIYLDKASRRTREKLSPAAFAAAEKRGQTLSLEKAARMVIPILESWAP